jgi:hypothetical protein
MTGSAFSFDALTTGQCIEVSHRAEGLSDQKCPDRKAASGYGYGYGHGGLVRSDMINLDRQGCMKCLSLDGQPSPWRVDLCGLRTQLHEIKQRWPRCGFAIRDLRECLHLLKHFDEFHFRSHVLPFLGGHHAVDVPVAAARNISLTFLLGQGSSVERPKQSK